MRASDMDVAGLILTASMALLPAQAADIPACGVELHLRAKASVVEVDHEELQPSTAFEIALVNTTDHAVTLVLPGDGSGAAWRTPILRWAISSEKGYAEPPAVRCGNINSLRPDDVFTLAPGERRPLRDWVPPIPGIGAGTYTLRLSYVNDPTLRWQGIELGPHDVIAMQRVRESTPCRVVGNEVTVTVVPKRRGSLLR